MAHRDPLFDITGKTAIVTGASSGLGVVFSNILGERGANVVLAARRTERLEEVAGRIIKGGGKAIAVSCDVGDAAQVKHMVATAAAHFARVDILVNNAGQVADGGPVPERLPDELFEQLVGQPFWYRSPVSRCARVVYEDVHAAKVLGSSGYHVFHLRRITHVA